MYPDSNNVCMVDWWYIFKEYFLVGVEYSTVGDLSQFKGGIVVDFVQCFLKFIFSLDSFDVILFETSITYQPRHNSCLSWGMEEVIVFTHCTPSLCIKVCSPGWGNILLLTPNVTSVYTNTLQQRSELYTSKITPSMVVLFASLWHH